MVGRPHSPVYWCAFRLVVGESVPAEDHLGEREAGEEGRRKEGPGEQAGRASEVAGWLVGSSKKQARSEGRNRSKVRET